MSGGMMIAGSWRIQPSVTPDTVKSIIIGSSTLDVELNKISKLRGLEMPEAIAFYSGRIVEFMANQTLLSSSLDSYSSLNLNLDLLYQLGKLSEGSLAIGNSLRRLGNQARHMKRFISLDEEVTIIGLLQIWIECYLISEHQKAGSPSKVFFIDDWSSQASVLRLFTFGGSGEINSKFNTIASLKGLKNNSTMACFVGERLIDCKSSLANIFTEEVRVLFPNYHRAAEIRALYCSRNGKPKEAIEILDPLTQWEFVGSETYGILGGAFKNLWIESQDLTFLDKAHQQYSNGIYKSPDDYYLKINLAATTFWLGNRELAKVVATEVIHLLDKFMSLAEINQEASSNYWVIATLAEANFLCEKYSESLALYTKLHSFDYGKGRWTRVCEQLKLHLDRTKKLEVHHSFYSLIKDSSLGEHNDQSKLP